MKNHAAQSNFGTSLKLWFALFLGLMPGALLPWGGQAFAQNTSSIFGPNVTIIPAGTSAANIQTALENIAGSTYTANPTGGQFGTNRNAVLFMPGTYTVQAPIGYYTTVAGLGQNPGAVVINGFITPNFGAWTTWNQGNGPGADITNYFWRSMENMTVNTLADASQGDGVSELQWGVAQGSSLRRMSINGGLELTDTYCGNASGGFTADTQVTGQVNSCSSTQWFTRNSSIGSWINGVWNMVFSGVAGAPAPNYPGNSYTVLPTTPVVREKPFLYVDNSSNFWVFSPSLLTNSSGTSWAGGGIGSGDAGTSLAISTFLIATPSTPLATINAWLATAGQNLILTPGIYQYSGAIAVTNANTVVLGLGYADLVPQTGTPAITVADVDGVQIAGLLIDAGPVNSPILLQVGVAGTDTGVSHAGNPTSINDVFFRIGGATAGTATESLEVDSENVILDNVWAWRADHGNAGTTGWGVNTAANGLVVNGANVIALGLAAEHYQQSQVVWNGQGGETVFLESELPYDVPSQAAWMDGAVNGYPAYYVAPGVTTHTTYGLGVYSNFNQGVNIVDASAISVPSAVGVTATDSVSVFLSGSGSITSTIDNAGTPVHSGAATSYVPFYQGAACTTTCPAAATNLTATLTYPSSSLIPQIALAWTPGATTNAVNTIYRGSTPNFTPSVANQLVAGISNATTTYTDTSVTNGSGYYYVVQSQSLGGVAYSNVASAGIPAAGGVITTDVVAINAGGPAIAGTSWAADEDVTGGGTENNGSATVTIPAGMVGAAPQAVYQTMHNGAFTYAIPGLNAGQTYIVNLHFNEDWVGIPTNGRIFNISINGSTALSNFQIFVAAGGSNVANIQSFTATADSTGTITVAATAVTNNPIISGIEIGTGTLAGSPTGATPPVQPVGLNAALPPTTGVATSALPVTLTWIASTTPGVTYNVYRSTASGFTPSTATQIISGVTSTTFEDYSASGGATYYYLVQAVSAGGTINSNQATATTGEIEVESSDVFDINCGTDTTDVPGTLGVDWVPDASAAATVPSTPTAPGFTVSGGGTDQFGTTVVPAGLIDAAPALVYQTFHSGVFTYTIFGLTPSTEYLVNLHLAEDYFSQPNQRVWSLIVNGVTVFPDYDAVAATGGAHIANVQAVNALSDSNGTITVSSSALINNPLLAGIEVGFGVLPGNPTGPNPPAQPTGLTATAISAAQVNLSWNPSATPGVTYGVFRSTTTGFTPSLGNQLAASLTATTTTYIDSTVSPNTTYYYLVQALASDNVSTTNSNQASATTGAIAADVVDINCGGGEVSGTLGVNWAADEYFTGGGTENNGGATVTIPAGMAGAAPQAVYQTMHNGAFTYAIPGLNAGQTYVVSLHFNEDWVGIPPNGRIFNISINGTQVLTNFQIAVAAGGSNVANIQSFTATADLTGTITIAATAVTNNPLISGIEIGTSTPPAGPSAPTGLTATAISASEIDLGWTASSTSGVTYSVFRSTTSGFTPAPANQLATGLSATTYKDTTVSGGTTYYYVVQAVKSGSTANSNQANATTPAASLAITADVVDINAGGGEVDGTLGVDWAADEYFTGGTATTDGTTVTVPGGLVNAAPQAIYQTDRYGVFSYAVPGLTPNGGYVVALHFSENYWSTAGSRVFNVSINGTQVLTGFDIVAAAGANHTANVQSFAANADGTGTITIAFSAVTDNPLVCGIEIGTAAPPALGAPTGLTATAISGGEVDLSWTASSTSGATYSVFRSTTSGFTPALANQLATGLTVTTYKDTTVTGSTTYYYLVQAVESGSTADSNQASATTPISQGEITADVVDINAGGGEVNGTLGVNWAADEYFTGGTVVADNTLITIPAGLINAAPEAVYQSNRYGSFSYAVPGLTPNGSYIVDLHFEENYWSTAGSRIFNVSINGTQVLTNFDIVAAAGANHTANIQSFAVSADGTGTMNIVFIPVKDNPLVCGIEIGTGLVGAIPAAPSSLNATVASSSEIDLSWPASATLNVTYSVFRGTLSGFVPGPSNQLASGLSTLTYNDTGLTPATTYYYAVEAYSGLLNSGAAEASATTLPPPCTVVPTIPASLSANAASAAEVDLAWGASFAPVGCPITYNVYRGTTSGFVPSSGNLLTTSAVSEPFYDDTASLSASTTYYYAVEAVDAAGSSAPSPQANATTLATGATLWTQVWGDDFTGAAGTTYDHTKWWNEIAVNTGNAWGDGTIQSTSDSLQNVYLDGSGHLVEAMTYNPAPGAGQTTYTSARLHSIENIGYGRIDASIQNPSAPGMGAAFWAMGSDLFLPGTHNEAGATPWPWCGELDMMELQASDPAHNGSTIHGGETDGGTQYEYEGVSVGMNLPGGEPNFDQGFHTVTTLWGPYHVQYFMDGVQYGDVNLANLGATDVWPLLGPSDNYTINLIISSGIGGNGGTPGTTGFPSNYTFDYVHYSTLTSGAPSPATGLAASQVYSNAVQLNWTASATADVTYNIYASTNPNAKLDLSTLIEQNASATSFLAGGLNPGTTYYFTVLASNWGGESSNVSVQATTSAAGNSTGVQMSAGGYAVGSYLNSQYVLGGNTNYHYGNVVDTSQVANPAPAEVYTTERWGAAAWTITGLNPSAGYNVRLHFVEAAHTAANQRAFNVSINSAMVLNNFDIVAAAGAPNTAVTQEFFTHANENGIIELQTLYGTSAVVGMDLNPTISAIEIVPTSLSNPPVGSAVGATPGTTTDLAIASGAPAATGKFVADEDFIDGDSNAPYPYTATVALNGNSAPQGVYDYERYTPFTYVLTGLVADTPYTVNLHFAEMYWNGPGDRVFNVAINGSTVLPNLDVYKVTGGMDIAFDPWFTANADMYGQIILQFIYGGADQPFINGLEVVQGSPSVVISPASESYGNVVLNTSVVRHIGIVNHRKSALTTSWSLSGSGFTIDVPSTTCTSTLAPNGAYCVIGVSLTPTATGSYSGSLAITTSAGNQTVTLSGTGTPAIAISPVSENYGNVVLNTSVVRHIGIVNYQATPLTISTPVLTGSGFAIDPSTTCTSTLAPNSGYCVIGVSLTPTATGSYSGSLAITTSAGNQTVTLSGTGTPAIAISPVSENYGNVVLNTSVIRHIGIVNYQATPLTISTPVLTGSGFAIDPSTTCTSTLAPNSGYCVIGVSLTPTATGPYSGSLAITTSAGNQTVILSGTGTPAIAISPVSENYGNVVLNTSVIRHIGIVNYQATPLTISTPVLTGSGFAIDPSTTCTSTLAPNSGYCVIGVSLTPTVAGSYSGSLAITTSAGNQTVTLSGKGIAP
jgi:fibronectin type 3 domain-containing protein